MDSLSARLLTDPYTALHEASEAAVTDTVDQLTAELTRALDSLPSPWDETNKPQIAQVLGAALAPLVARYAHAITGVQTLRALLNAGTLEFHPEGTVTPMSELLQEVADFSRLRGDDASNWAHARAVGEAAARLLADFRDAEPTADDVAAANAIVDTLPEPEAPHTAAVAAIEATEAALEAAQSSDPAVAAAAVQVARTAVEAAEMVIEADAIAADAGVSLRNVDEVKAADERRIEAAEAFDDAELERLRAASRSVATYPPPYYEVYRADAGGPAPHCITPTYDSALSYCRAANGTPWHILEIDDQGEAILVTDVKIDGMVVELTYRVPPFHVAEPEPAPELNADDAAREEAIHEALEPVRAAAAELDDAGVWFTVRRGDDPHGGDFCRTPHYAIALEYCQGSPGVPWTIEQTIDGVDAARLVVTTVDDAGDVTEVGERGAQ